MRKVNRNVFPIFAYAIAAFAWGEPVTMRYMEFPHALPGAVFKVEKYRDDGTGLMKTKIGGVARSTEDLLLWQNLEEQSRLGRLGRLSEEVENKRMTMGNFDQLKVVIKPKYPQIRYPDKTLATNETMIASSLSAAAVGPLTDLDVLESRYGLSGCIHEGKGKTVCDVTKEQLQSLKADADVGSVAEFKNEPAGGVELSTLAIAGYNPGPVPSGAGYGVHAATFESGLSSAFLGCIGVSATYDAYTTTNVIDIQHTQAVFKTLALTAPSATFFHRKTYTYDGTDDVNYIINNGIQTVSLSLARGTTTPYRSTYPEFLTMDDFAYRYPYPVFATLTYNSGYQYEVNWQCYNAISVGNVRNTNGTTYEMAECMQAKNPPPVYGSCISGTGADCAGDREMPYVVAPGIPGTGTDFATTCLEGRGGVNCGTSLSAPVVSGLAADVIAADSRLAGWPEKVRATLMLTAQNVEGGDWLVSSDDRDGTGVVSGSEAVAFAQSHTSVSPGNTAVEKGMTAGSWYAADFSANKRFNFLVPNPKPSGKHLRVVLTWDSNPIVGGSTNALSDLDLIVQYNGGTQSSASWDSNVEVVDVGPASLTAGSSYYIDIAPYANRIPASGSRTNFFYYSLAWEWVKDHAP
ncbi:MAG: S8 family serine peptidase [Fibrobacteres bacterium]|nr:S8 family serine peptidase [Fibrobacterota bacterium]